MKHSERSVCNESQRASLLRQPVSGQATQSRKQSKTGRQPEVEVGEPDSKELPATGGGITTIRIPILGFDTVLDDPCYTSSLNFPVSVETLEA
ncbi:Protein of unknown function [Gryllus bimaculatus]|nr:Protein of unknown function [Gryllus bimaculatus]